MAANPPMSVVRPLTQDQLDAMGGAYGSWYTDPGVAGPGLTSYANPITTDAPWTHPDYAGTDSAYAAWLAQADVQSGNTISDAKRRRAQAEEQFRQAMQDLNTQSVNGRRTIQNNMLARGMFGSGEFGRRRQEFDSAIDTGKSRAQGAEANQLGQIDQGVKDFMSNLGMQGVQQVSQATLRDQVAAYNAQQAAAAQAAPQPVQQTAQAPAAQNSVVPVPHYAPAASGPAQPGYKPVTALGTTAKKAAKPPVSKLVRSGLS